MKLGTIGDALDWIYTELSSFETRISKSRYADRKVTGPIARAFDLIGRSELRSNQRYRQLRLGREVTPRRSFPTPAAHVGAILKMIDRVDVALEKGCERGEVSISFDRALHAARDRLEDVDIPTDVFEIEKAEALIAGARRRHVLAAARRTEGESDEVLMDRVADEFDRVVEIVRAAATASNVLVSSDGQRGAGVRDLSITTAIGASLRGVSPEDARIHFEFTLKRSRASPGYLVSFPGNARRKPRLLRGEAELLRFLIGHVAAIAAKVES